jgi:hypothetical protein
MSRGQQQRREQRQSPLEVKAQRRHGRPAAPRHTGRASLYWWFRHRGTVKVLKFLIVVVMVLLVASLASGLYFLMVDQGDPGRRRLFNSLGVRLTLALALMGLIVFGVATGRLGHGNPWDGGPLGAAEARQ